METITKARFGNTVIDLVQGDITEQEVDAIVNAANSSLAGGGGVDGAIHRVAGADLLKECLTLGRCPTGEARITKGYNLPAKHVIHAVGPVYHQHDNHAQLLAGAHTHSLKLAQENHLKTIAFPAISTGIYGYPLNEAAAIALTSVIEYIKTQQLKIGLVRFVLFSADAFEIFSQALHKLAQSQDNQ